LHEQIKEFGVGALAGGYNRFQVVPLFLLPGVHVIEDIPAEVAIAQQALGEEVKIDLRPHLGTHTGLSRLLANQMAATKKAAARSFVLTTSGVDAWILLAHGSRRSASKQPVEAMATQLESQAAEGCAVSKTSVVMPAYWAVPPKLELRVKELVNAGHRQIGILPYFLFPGGITDAIAQSVEELKFQFPDTVLHLAEPLGASGELADLIWDLIEK
jgi:sirohydrochlorin ferrochelatase